jgi:hypothetical protein
VLVRHTRAAQLREFLGDPDQITLEPFNHEAGDIAWKTVDRGLGMPLDARRASEALAGLPAPGTRGC